jgi:cardiolipin synthase
MGKAPLPGLDPILALWPYLAGVLYAVVSLVASGHAVLRKRDTRAAIGWVGLIWLAPILGTLLYVWLGINRIERRARALRTKRPPPGPPAGLGERSADVLDQALALEGRHLQALVRLVGDVTRRALVAGNRITPLANGDQAYPAMLRAITEASQSITLSTYIFNHDRAGRRFLEALRRAVSRGVEVRLLIDDVGARYGWPPMPRALRKAGIPAVTFLPTRIPWRFQYSNLRTHRKILVVDGKVGFTGGLNISEGNCLEHDPSHPVQDLHFHITGPVVAQLCSPKTGPSAPARS